MAKWLHRQGAFVRVADSRSNPPNVEALQQAAPGAELLPGPFVSQPFVDADLVALSPGVPKATPEIAVVADKPRAVNAEHRVQPEQRHIMDEHIKAPLQEA